MELPKPPQKLWTKNFTIITLGSVVSMFGNAVSGFIIGLLVLDYTQSVLLYALFMVAYSLPRIILPVLAGSYLDRFSRRKVIYTLDFVSCGLYLIVYLLLRNDWFHYVTFLMASVVIGSIDSIYTVAYDSFYPTLISEGNFTRAYSVSSLIYPLAQTIMVPIAGVCYKTVGLAPLFLFNAASFLIAAVAETQISVDERHVGKRQTARFDGKKLTADLKDGFDYLKREHGLAFITAYFFMNTLCFSISETLMLPYFKLSVPDGITRYAVIMAISTAGRLVGGGIHYRFRYPTAYKFAIAVFVYIALHVLEGGFLFLPYAGMIACHFMIGLLGVTSYNIRVTGTQSYVDDSVRGRFNGVFSMMFFMGSIIGRLLAGAVSEFIPLRTAIVAAEALGIIAVICILLPGREAVKRIYNVNV